MTLRLIKAIAAAAATVTCLASAAMATVYEVPVTGNLGGNPFSADLLLDVTDGQATSGTGSFTGFGLMGADLVLITTSTPGNETTGGPSAPTGFRANDGTDIFGGDQAYPIDGNGLIFDVGTKTAAFGEFPVLNIAANQPGFVSIFTGNVNGTEFYNQQGYSDIGPGTAISGVPEPSTWAMMLLGMGALGALGYRKKDAALLG